MEAATGVGGAATSAEQVADAGSPPSEEAAAAAAAAAAASAAKALADEAAEAKRREERVRIYTGRAKDLQDKVEALAAALRKTREEQRLLYEEATGAEDPEARAKLEVLRGLTINVATGHKRTVLDSLEELRAAFPGDDVFFLHTARTTNGLTTFFRGGPALLGDDLFASRLVNLLVRSFHEVRKKREPSIIAAVRHYFDYVRGKAAGAAPAPEPRADVDVPDGSVPTEPPTASAPDTVPDGPDVIAFNQLVADEYATITSKRQVDTYARSMSDPTPRAIGINDAQTVRQLYEKLTSWVNDPRLGFALKRKIQPDVTKLKLRMETAPRAVDNGAPLPPADPSANAAAAAARNSCRCPKARNEGPCTSAGAPGCINTYGDVKKEDPGFCGRHCLGFKMLLGWDAATKCDVHPRKADEKDIRSRMYPPFLLPPPNGGASAGELAAAATAVAVGRRGRRAGPPAAGQPAAGQPVAGLPVPIPSPPPARKRKRQRAAGRDDAEEVGGGEAGAPPLVAEAAPARFSTRAPPDSPVSLGKRAKRARKNTFEAGDDLDGPMSHAGWDDINAEREALARSGSARDATRDEAEDAPEDAPALGGSSDRGGSNAALAGGAAGFDTENQQPANAGM